MFYPFCISKYHQFTARHFCQTHAGGMGQHIPKKSCTPGLRGIFMSLYDTLLYLPPPRYPGVEERLHLRVCSLFCTNPSYTSIPSVDTDIGTFWLLHAYSVKRGYVVVLINLSNKVRYITWSLKASLPHVRKITREIHKMYCVLRYDYDSLLWIATRGGATTLLHLIVHVRVYDYSQ